MRVSKRFHAQRFFLFVVMVAGICSSIGLSGCSPPTPVQPQQGPRKYALTGRVVSIDKAKQHLTVDAADIPGFMMAMAMGYSVKNPSLLDSVSPEDQIKADVVVNGSDVHLENIVVTKKADASKAPAAGTATPMSDKK